MANHPVHHLSCRVIGLEDATHDVRVIRLEITDGGPFQFSAGQYASVTFEALPPRDYSMANCPNQANLEFHIRQIGDDGASGYVARKLRVGDRVGIEGPYGEAWLRQDHSGPILAIAGGSGLAPIKSIVETALVADMQQDIHLYFAVSDEPDIYLEEHFQTLARTYPNLCFVPVLSDPSGPTGRRTGLVSNAVAGDFARFNGFKAYLAGPPAMVNTTVEMLVGRGLCREDIHADPFYTEAEKTAQDMTTRKAGIDPTRPARVNTSPKMLYEGTGMSAGLVKPLAFVAQPFHLHDLLVTEIRTGGQRLVDFCHSPEASQRLLVAVSRLPSRRASQHFPVHAGHR